MRTRKEIIEYLEKRNCYIPLEGYGRVYTEGNVIMLLEEIIKKHTKEGNNDRTS
jgi:hypothetical protein